MPRYRMTFSYDGTAYAGYQRQAGEIPTIQACLEDRFFAAFHVPIVLHASGRTDAGVHARAQVAHFDFPYDLAPGRMVYAWNRQLPLDIRISEIRQVADDFHARKMAVGKRYAYHVTFDPRPSAIGYGYRANWPYPCDTEKIPQALAPLIGTHDFQAFCGVGSSVKTTCRTIHLARFDLRGQDGVFRFMGDGFLRHMVRIIVGTALDMASGSRPADAMEAAIKQGDRRLAGQTAPASGLFLEAVYYEKEAYFAACQSKERT